MRPEGFYDCDANNYNAHNRVEHFYPIEPQSYDVRSHNQLRLFRKEENNETLASQNEITNSFGPDNYRDTHVKFSASPAVTQRASWYSCGKFDRYACDCCLEKHQQGSGLYHFRCRRRFCEQRRGLGHIQNSCPANEHNLFELNTLIVEQTTNRAQVNVCNETGNLSVSFENRDFYLKWDKDKYCNILKLWINGEIVDALLDTGADFTVFGNSFLEQFPLVRNKLIPFSKTLLTAGQNTIDVVAHATIFFKIGSRSFSIIGCYCPGTSCHLILALDFMQKYRIKLDFGRHCIQIPYKLNLYSNLPYSIEPYSEKVVTCHFGSPLQCSITGVIVGNSKLSELNLILEEYFVKLDPNCSDVEIRILNPTSDTKFIEQMINIADLEPFNGQDTMEPLYQDMNGTFMYPDAISDCSDQVLNPQLIEPNDEINNQLYSFIETPFPPQATNYNTFNSHI